MSFLRKPKGGLEEFFLEESINTSEKKLDSLELPLSRRAFVLILVVIALVVLITVGQLVFLGGWRGSFYSARAEANVGREVYLPAARGVIYDRFGNPLVENIETFSLAIKVKNLVSGQFGQLDLSGLLSLLDLSEEELRVQFQEIDLERISTLIIARDIEPEKIVQLKSLDLDGVEIINDYKRYYPSGSIFAHILGYTGFGSSNEIKGMVGLEAYYDEFLRGEPGKSIIYRDALGNLIDKKLISLAENGSSLNTTIDSELQRYFYYRLWEALDSLGSRAAVGIALNPQNGEVLSLVSLPSYNNNIFGKTGHNTEKLRLLNSSSKPLFNRSVSGIYSPGSTIKPLMALAALNEGVVDIKTQVYSAGYIEIPNPYYPDQPSIFLDWKPHGWVNLYSALAKSSNIYFYAVGGGVPADAEPEFEKMSGLGIETIKEYWEMLGFGEKTGIDLTAEGEGFLPDPQEKELRTNDIWRLGDTYNISIGQGDLLVTPIQLINQIASIANSGKLYKPHLAKGKPGSENSVGEANLQSSRISTSWEPEVLVDYSDLGEQLKEVQKGMRDAVRKWYGTAYLLDKLPFGAAGKTGSAQVGGTKTNAFFVGYAPAEDPQIAILVLVENAKEGSLNAVPVAKDVLEWYYYNRIAGL